MQKLRKKGKKIEPVEINGRTIARSFWGKAWCNHLESFSDFSNRLQNIRTQWIGMPPEDSSRQNQGDCQRLGTL